MSEKPRSHWVRQADADRLENSLGRLPRKSKRPALVIMIGLPGSGKSHLAREIKRRFPAVILDSDAMRQVLFAQPKHTKAEHGRLFPAIHLLIARLLERGVSVIVDATNLKEPNRKPYYKLAEEKGARVLLVRTWAPRPVIRQRLNLRDAGANDADRSTATLEVFEKMLADVERIPRKHISVNTSKELTSAVDKIIRDLSAFGV
jgi:predicted kinase